ncbi:MAG: PAS domain S-box protein [Prolixibacteraceae bacterium]|nr:PAS domain S-box protein [Prolixibacteraceae bacterium]
MKVHGGKIRPESEVGKEGKFRPRYQIIIHISFMGKIEKAINFIFAEDEDLTIENRVFLSAIIIGIFTSLIGSVINLVLNTSVFAAIIPLLLSVILFILYYFVRFKRIHEPYIFPVIVISIFGISVIWVFNGGINGYNVMPGFVILILGLITVSDIKKKYVIILFLSSFTSIYLLQFYRPDLIVNFDNENDRWMDSIFTLFYSSYFVFLIIKFLHENYTRERIKANESEEKFRFMTENSGDTIWHLDSNYCFDYVSPADERMRGFKKEEVIGTPIWSLLKPEGIEHARKVTVKLLEDEQKGIKTGTIRFELELKCRDNSWIWAEVNSSTHYNADGTMVGLNGVIRDISLRKKAEQEILLTNEELKGLVATKDKLFSIIAHDLRSPFNSFLGLTQVMAEDLPNLTMSQAQEMAVSMNKSATNLYRLLETLLQWSQIQKGALSFNPEVIFVNQILTESIAMVIEPAKNKRIEITTDISEDLTVFADSNLLQTIIRNLIYNAIKYTVKGGKVKISAKKNTVSKNVEISVKDNGIGMDQIILDNLFRVDLQTSRKGTEGEPCSGLGLLLCKEFVEKHGGKIWVKSEVEKGSTFYFTIPNLQN